MDFLNPFSDYQSLLVVFGLLALSVALLSPIETNWFVVRPPFFQKLMIAGLGIVGVTIGTLLIPKNGEWELPKGTIIPWANFAGNLTPPDGWVVCGNGFDTPSLDKKFLRGSESVQETGATGGRVDIPADGKYDKQITTSRNKKPSISFEINCQGTCDVDTNHEHTFDLAIPNHDHGGDNTPPYYSVLYLCKFE